MKRKVFMAFTVRLLLSDIVAVKLQLVCRRMQ